MKMLRAALALSLIAGSVQAQQTDSALVGRIKQDVDSITRDKSRPGYVVRAQARIKARTDTILTNKNDTVLVVRVDTVYVSKDTTVTPPPPPPPVTPLVVAIHSNGTGVNVGSTLQLSATVTQGTTVIQKAVTWSITEGSAFGTISSTGLLTGVAGGNVTVRASADTFYTSRPYLVTGSPPPTDTSSPPKDTSIVVTPGGGGATLTHPFPPPSNGATFAELPRAQVDVTYPALSPDTVRVPLIGNLQTAIDNAPAGAVILLPAGSVYTGNFMLSKNNCPKWTIIRTDLSDAQIGAPGTRMTPTRAAGVKLARLNGQFGQGGLGTVQGANVGCYRIVGIESAQAPGAYDANGLFAWRKGSHDIIIDRSYGHGEDNVAVRRCISLNNENSAIVDSYFTDCSSLTGDAQVILGYEGNGPYLIRNNWLEGGTETIMWGGATGALNSIPSDIIVEYNEITRDPRDKTANVATIKNLIESKNSQRSLYQFNKIHNNWAQGQVGFGILLKSVNQSSGACTWCRTTDVTIRNNTYYNTTNFFNLANIQESPAQPAARYSIYNNVLDSLAVPGSIYATDYSGGMEFQFLGGTPDIIIMHNTMKGPGNWGMAQWDGGVPNPRMVFEGNILWCGGYGLKGSNMSSGVNSWNGYTQNGLWKDNALWGCGTPTSTYPAGTAFFTSPAAITDPKYGVQP